MVLHAGNEGPLLSLKVEVRVTHHQGEGAHVGGTEDDEEKETMLGHFDYSDESFLRGRELRAGLGSGSNLSTIETV